MEITLSRLFSLLLLAFSIAACSGDDTTAVSYGAYNHTDKSIVSIIVNGEGGILNAHAHAGGEKSVVSSSPTNGGLALPRRSSGNSTTSLFLINTVSVLLKMGFPFLSNLPGKNAPSQSPSTTINLDNSTFTFFHTMK